MSEALSAEDLKAIRERCEKATPGPWMQGERGLTKYGHDDDNYRHITRPSDDKFTIAIWPDNGTEDEDAYDQRCSDTAAFVAHSRTDIPALLSEIARLSKIEERAKEWHDSFWALYTIAFSHALIDRYQLARYVVIAKNSLTDWKDRAKFRTLTGYSNQYPCTQAAMILMPLNTILLIVADNTIHLCINFAALRWL